MSYDKDLIKNELCLEDVYTLLEEWGGNPTPKGNMITCDTICHNLPGEGSHKLYYYDNTKLFKCYTGCGGDYFDIYELYAKVRFNQFDEEISTFKAIQSIAQRFGHSSIQDDGFIDQSSDWAIFKNHDKVEKKKEKKVELNILDDRILTCFPKPTILPWINEGISKKTMQRFEIGYYPKDCQIVIPHRDSNNNLIGIRGRSLVKEDAEIYGKYRPLLVNRIMYNHPLSFALYGLGLNKKNISAVKKAVVFEGEKSVLLYDSIFGSENNISVASCGSNFHRHQFDLLIALGVEEIIIAYDRQFKEQGDSEFIELTKNLRKISDKYKSYVTISFLFDKSNLLDYKSSPIDHGKETYLELFRNRIVLG